MGGALGSLTAEMVLETFNHDHIDKLKVAITEEMCIRDSIET